MDMFLFAAYSYRVKVIDSEKKSNFIVRELQLHHFDEKFATISMLKS